MRIQILIVVFFLTLTFLNAQVINNYGVKFGFVSSNMDVKFNPNDVYVGFGNNEFYENRRSGIAFGGFIILLENDFMNFETELLYYEEGSEDKLIITGSEGPDPIDETNWDHAYNFLKLTINARPTLKLEKTQISLILGPTLNYLIKNRDLFYLHEKLKKVHFGYNVGIGFIFPELIKQPVFIELKYNNYFDDFVNNSRVKANMSSFNINVGLLLK